MSTPPQRPPHCGLLLYSALWPWGLLGPLPGLLILCLLASSIISVVRERKLLVPFELLWPPFLLAVGTAWSGCSLELTAYTWVALAFFVGTTHLTPGPAQARLCLQASAFSGACVAAFSIAAHLFPSAMVIPMGYSVATGMTMTAASDIPTGAWTLSLCLLLALLEIKSSNTRRQRVLWGLAGMLLAITLSRTVVQALPHLDSWRPPMRLSMAPPAFLTLLVALWLVARVAAKLHVAREEFSRSAVATPLSMLAVSVLFLLLAPMPLRPHHTFLLGLCAAYATPRQDEIRQTKITPMVAAVAAALIWVNLWPGFPRTYPYDPRNYERAAQKELAMGRYDALSARMDYVERLAPEERRTHFWRAKAALDQKQYRQAAAELTASIEPLTGQEWTLLPPPKPSKVDQITAELRDVFSSLKRPPPHLGYERLLVARGETRGALKLLDIRRNHLRPATDNSDPEELLPAPEALRAGLAFLLGDPGLSSQFENWSAADLLAVLRNCGGQVAQAPKKFPRDRLPLVLAAYTGARDTRIYAHCDTQPATLLARPSHPAPTKENTLAWNALGQSSPGTWLFELTHGPYAAIATAQVNPESSCALQETGPRQPPIADSTALLIWR